LIDEFLAKSGQGRCRELKETAEVIAKVIVLESSSTERESVCVCVKLEQQFHTEKLRFDLKIGFKMFLGVTASVVGFDQKNSEFSLVIEDNPLTDFVELPEKYKTKLNYNNILCGVLRGALEMVTSLSLLFEFVDKRNKNGVIFQFVDFVKVQMDVECKVIRDVLRGDEVTEIKVHLKEYLKEYVPVGED
jgi:hypothetical protein